MIQMVASSLKPRKKAAPSQERLSAVRLDLGTEQEQ
jgi:hypothetical protein